MRLLYTGPSLLDPTAPIFVAATDESDNRKTGPMVPAQFNLPARIVEKIEVSPNGCWLWKAATGPTGYARVSWEGKNVAAHRVVYLLVVGMLPHAGLELDHDCRVRHCVNPQHLIPRTHAANSHRTRLAVAKCGHPHTREERNGRRGYTARRCAECRKAYLARMARERRKAAA